MFDNDGDNGIKQSSLGRDFLTFICYRSDKYAGVFKMPGLGQEFFLWIDGKIVMEDDQGSPANSVTYSGDDFSAPELKHAISSGKKVKEAKLRIEKGENTWSFLLKAERMQISGLKLDMPKVKDNDLDENFFTRILSVEALNSIIDELYKYFLAEFHSGQWQSKGYTEFQNWLKEK